MKPDTCKNRIFGNLDLRTIAQNPEFKEDSVREIVILPILKHLGYEEQNIVRSKTLEHPFLKVGSNKKIAIKLVPDYVLKVGDNFAWVLDAKAPNKKIVNHENVEQVYSYAIHPEIRSTYFALCNGVEFSLFRTTNPNEPILFFEISEIEHHWENLTRLLSPASFQTGKNITHFVDTGRASSPQNDNDWYKNRPLLDQIKVKKRTMKRHFGVHGYFTKQSWNVVNEYIKNFSKPGDLVLDPFGGSGVTAIEALMTGRKGVNVDINPLAVFIVNSLIAPVNLPEFYNAFNDVKTEYLKHEPKTAEEIKKALKKYKGCKSLPLPKGSDVSTTDLLFSDKQTAQLALLKSIIRKQKNENIRNSLLLCFSGVVTRVNLTYHISTAVKAGTGFGGDASAMRYYRYRIAKKPTKVDVMQCFEMRFQNIKKAKQEMAFFINEDTIGDAQIAKGTATDLSFLLRESVDYIYTDPPYGKKIPYLDLSAMWNAWLDLKVTEEDYKFEAIEGGEHNKTKDDYNQLIAQSIREMYRVLKFDRWLSFVFAHKDPEFWHLIINTAESCGFEYAGAVAQKNGQTSFKKRQHPFTVLSGQLIINFRKARNPRAIMNANLGMNISEIVMQTVEGLIAKYSGATLEQINDELIIRGLELGFLDLLKKEYSDLTPILKNCFDYDAETELFTMRKNSKFTANIPLELRIRYYLISYLRRMERENKTSTFDEIILDILPLLRNGTTPENQTVLSVLEDIGEHTGEGKWRLKQTQQILF
jgi:tRNA G10  N-methylase Trm11